MSKCPICGASAYQGFNSFECSTAGCKNFKAAKEGAGVVKVSFRDVKPRLGSPATLRYGGHNMLRTIAPHALNLACGHGVAIAAYFWNDKNSSETTSGICEYCYKQGTGAVHGQGRTHAQKVADFGGHAGLYGGAAAPGKTEALHQEIYRSFDQTISRAILGAPAEEPTPEDKFDTDEVAAKLKAHFFDAFRTKFNGFAPLQDLDPRAVVGFVSSWFDDRLPQLLEDECCVIDGEDAPLHGVDCECACGECPDPKGPPSDAPKA